MWQLQASEYDNHVYSFGRFIGECGTTTKGLVHFYSCCRPQVVISENDVKRKALLSAFLRRIDVLVDSGRYPNPSGLSLRGIIVEGLFVEDMPEIEIWSSTGPIYNSNSSSRYTSWDYDEATAVYDVNRDIVGDFAIVVRLGESDIEDDGSVSSSKRSSLIEAR